MHRCKVGQRGLLVRSAAKSNSLLPGALSPVPRGTAAPQTGVRTLTGCGWDPLCSSFRAPRFAQRCPGTPGQRKETLVCAVFARFRNSDSRGAGLERAPHPARAQRFGRKSPQQSLSGTPVLAQKRRLRRRFCADIFSFPPGAAHFLVDVSKRKWGAHPRGDPAKPYRFRQTSSSREMP